ncbi:MAG: hypothetical protein AAF840_18930 [Bacteroidota bacterium]
MERKLMPSLAIEHHQKDGEIRSAAYRIGHPRQYRFNATLGRVNLNGDENLTKAGDPFTFRPIGARIFKDNLFERGKQLWAELFFLNEANQVCNILVHGYTVENLERLESDLFYDDLNITEVMLTLKPAEKTSKSTGNKFYIGEWSYRPADRELIECQNSTVDGLQLFRVDTFKDTAEELVALNFSPPVASLASASH